MNAVEIEEAVSLLAAKPCEIEHFPFQFLAAFGNNDVTIKKLRTTGKSSSNKSDVEGGVLQRLNIHIGVSERVSTDEMLDLLRKSPQTTKGKVKYVLATDGSRIEAEELASGEVLSCAFSELGDNFGFFLSLAGISVVREVKDNPIDIKATSRLNKLYVELLKHNPDWASADGQIAFNQFLARLVFCFFAEDTGVFRGKGLFSNTVSKMSEAEGGNTHLVLQELFQAMDSDPRDGGRKPPVKGWADVFPYVNGGLFSGSTQCPLFTRTARSYLLRAGELDWQAINPDIFGSMIQAVADDEERSSLGMHYTSVPNIEKVINPLFLDSLNEQLKIAGENSRKLLNLRKRLAKIRVFDPACGSGNFLVIAYIRMREIEAEIMKRRGEPINESIIRLTQFYGVEIKPFAVEVARLSLLISEFQCNVRLIGQMQAQMLILPLHETGHIVVGNALRLEWAEVCPQDTEKETYICGNPPYVGDKKQTKHQKSDIESLFSDLTSRWKSLDYIAGFFIKGAQYLATNNSQFAFVSTNSICQGQQLNVLWSILLRFAVIQSAHIAFKWSNLASNKAGVTVVIVHLANLDLSSQKYIYDGETVRLVSTISPYLTATKAPLVESSRKSICGLPPLFNGNAPKDGGNLLLNSLSEIPNEDNIAKELTKKYWGSDEIIKTLPRYCLWINGDQKEEANKSNFVRKRIENVREMRAESKKAATREWSREPYRFVEIRREECDYLLALPSVSTEKREYLTPILLTNDSIVSNLAFVMYQPEMWVISLLSSKLHYSWVRAVCGQLETRIRFSNTLGWNTFPVPKITTTEMQNLIDSASNILIAREKYFPATIAELYDPDEMPPDLRAAHEYNDEIVERIYIGRRFKNDTERLEKLFALYTEMTEASV